MNFSHDKAHLQTLPHFADAASADHILALLDDTGNLLGGAALWWSDVPHLPNQTLATIGSFHADTEEITHTILEEAEQILRAQNITQVIGPMNGNTWRKHRFVTFSNNRPPFALEPTNTHPDHPSWWQSHGYNNLSNYTSSHIQLDGSQVTPDRIRQRLFDNGITLHSLDPESFEHDLHSIYDLSIQSFSNNFLYTPMDWPSFFDQYNRTKSFLNPRYIILARCHDQTVGFCFCYPDPLAIQRNHQPALIVKTLASSSEKKFAGLGNLLVDEAQLRAHQDGFTEAIHALQFEDNTSLKITARFKGTVFRRYALFTKSLV